MRSDVHCATTFVKCLVLWVSSQSGLLAMEDRSTGASVPLLAVSCRNLRPIQAVLTGLRR